MSLCLTHRRSHHPFMPWASFWLWLLALTPSHFALWLIKLYRDDLVSETVSEMPFFSPHIRVIFWALLEPPTVWEPPVAMTRLLASEIEKTLVYGDQTLFVTLPFCSDCTSSHKSCPSQDFSLPGSCLGSPVPPPDVFSRPLPQCPVNCILIPHCSSIWLSDCSVALAGTD